jgi:Ctr copper transporter family
MNPVTSMSTPTKYKTRRFWIMDSTKETTMSLDDPHPASARNNPETHDRSPFDPLELAAAGSASLEKASSAERSFCRSSQDGMIMYMDGFHWTSGGGGGAAELTCLNILHPSWTIRTPMQLYGAMMAVFLCAALTEACAKFRQSLLLRFRTTQGNGSGHVSSAPFTSVLYRNRNWALPVLHGVHAFLGYLLMLVVMTYSLELLLSVMAGLMVGYWVFFLTGHPSAVRRGGADRRDAGDPEETIGMISGTDGPELSQQPTQYLLEQQWSAAASNPCCDFLHGPN